MRNASLREQLHFLSDQASEHAAATARLSQLMAGHAEAPPRVCVLTRETMHKRIHVAYVTGWYSGMCTGLLSGLLAGLALGCVALAIGAQRLMP